MINTEVRKVSNSKLENFGSELKNLFRGVDFFAAHEKARPILAEMAKSDDTLFEIIANCLRKPGFLESRRDNPVLALPIFEAPHFTLVANCWIPRPDGDTTISHQSIHHHGNLLLTSVSAFGPGYESFLFEAGPAIDMATRQASLKLAEVFRHNRGNIEFVGAGSPHLVFYPEKLSITYALWSRSSPRVAAKFGKIAPLEAVKPKLRSLSQKLGLNAFLGINQETDLDFYVRDNNFYIMKNRLKYPLGTRENFLQAVRYVLFHTGYSRELIEADVINEFDPQHLFIPRVSLDRQEVLACLR